MIIETILRGALLCLGALIVLTLIGMLYRFPPLLIVLGVILIASCDRRRHI